MTDDNGTVRPAAGPRAPWPLWAVGIVSFLWNAMGGGIPTSKRTGTRSDVNLTFFDLPSPLHDSSPSRKGPWMPISGRWAIMNNPAPSG